MTYDPYAGSCASGNHRWGKQIKISSGVYFAKYYEPCLKCSRRRIIEFTKRGNHVAGYETVVEVKT